METNHCEFCSVSDCTCMGKMIEGVLNTSGAMIRLMYSRNRLRYSQAILLKWGLENYEALMSTFSLDQYAIFFPEEYNAKVLVCGETPVIVRVPVIENKKEEPVFQVDPIIEKEKEEPVIEVEYIVCEAQACELEVIENTVSYARVVVIDSDMEDVYYYKERESESSNKNIEELMFKNFKNKSKDGTSTTEDGKIFVNREGGVKKKGGPFSFVKFCKNKETESVRKVVLKDMIEQEAKNRWYRFIKNVPKLIKREEEIFVYSLREDYERFKNNDVFFFVSSVIQSCGDYLPGQFSMKMIGDGEDPDIMCYRFVSARQRIIESVNNFKNIFGLKCGKYKDLQRFSNVIKDRYYFDQEVTFANLACTDVKMKDICRLLGLFNGAFKVLPIGRRVSKLFIGYEEVNDIKVSSSIMSKHKVKEKGYAISLVDGVESFLFSSYKTKVRIKVKCEIDLFHSYVGGEICDTPDYYLENVDNFLMVGQNFYWNAVVFPGYRLRTSNLV